jgi:hypothetical protein
MDKLLASLLNFGKEFNTLTSVSRLAIVGGAIFIISFMLGKSDGNSKLEKFNVEYSEFKNNAQKTATFADSLKTEVQKLQEKNAEKDNIVKRLRISVAFRSTQTDELKTSLVELEDRISMMPLPSDTSLTVAYKDSIIGNLKKQVVVADSTIVDQSSIITQKDAQSVLLQNAVTLSSTRADSLQHILRTLPKPAPNPNKLFGFIPKPSRTVVGVTGFVLGIVAGAELKR